jgi:hypothetical protein
VIVEDIAGNEVVMRQLPGQNLIARLHESRQLR